MAHGVIVYRYKYWDAESKSHKTSSLYATAGMIRNGLGHSMVETAMNVDASDLRDSGIYIPDGALPKE